MPIKEANWREKDRKKERMSRERLQGKMSERKEKKRFVERKEKKYKDTLLKSKVSEYMN